MPEGLFSDRNVVQIAGIRDPSEAEMIARCGVDLLGFPLRIERRNDDLSEAGVRDVIRRLPRSVRAVVITYLTAAGEIERLCRGVGAGAVQLHGDVPEAELEALRGNAPDLVVIKSLIVRGDNTAELKAFIDQTRPFVDAYITDTFDAATGARGATGRTHDWGVSRRVVDYSPHPVILAGGLTPGNVKSAVRTVRPFGVDAHTGVEDPSGRKSRELVERFVLEAREGWAVDAGKRRES